MRRAAIVAGLVVWAAALSASAAATFNVRAASYNIRCELSAGESDAANNWSSRKSDLVNLVKSISPDVIGFQEVRSSQLTELKKQLPGYTFVAVMRDSSSTSEATPVAFLTERFQLMQSGTFWLSATPNVSGSTKWGGGVEASGYPRICTWTLLKDRTSGGVFCFACTHFDLNAGPRLAGMRLILSSLAGFDTSEVPIVVVGDMNALETEDSMLAATAVMQDSLLVSKTAPTGPWRTFNGFRWNDSEVSCAEALAGYTAAERSANASALGKRIDYIFTSHDVVVESFTTRNDARSGKTYYPSDHYPVVADLSMPRANSLSCGKVRVEIEKSIPKVGPGRYVLTRGAKLIDDSNLEFVLPDWVERAAVEDGEIVIYTKPEPLFIRLR